MDQRSSQLPLGVLRRYGPWLLSVVAAVVAATWAAAHFSAAPGSRVSIAWGLVEYNKAGSNATSSGDAALRTWLATTVVALLTVFSDRIIGRVRFALNRADLRTKYFEELAIDLSSYVFFASLFHERYARGWADDPEDIAGIGGEINGAVTTLRKKEYVYRSWVRRYWKSRGLADFEELLHALDLVEDAIHAFNDRGDERAKTEVLGTRLKVLRAKSDAWLSQAGAG
jgi:hypothetical protein